MTTPKKTSITFVAAHIVDDLRKGSDDEESYKLNQKVSLEHASAMHFVRRGLAILTPTKNARAKAKAEDPVKVDGENGGAD